MLSWDDFRYVKAIADSRSLAGAAETLAVNHSTGFRRAYPDILLEVVVSNQRLDLSKRDADVAVRATYQPPDALAGRRAARIAWAIYGPKALASMPFDPAVDGRRHDWIAFADTAS